MSTASLPETSSREPNTTWKDCPSIKMPIEQLSELFRGSRHTFTSTTPYDTVLSRLKAEFLNRPEETHSSPAFLWSTPQDKSRTFNTLTSNVNSAVGPHNLMQFYAMNHGSILELHSQANDLPGPPRMQRLLIGNPLIMLSMALRDPRIALSAPVDILVMENPGQGTSIVYQEPIAMMTGCYQSKDERPDEQLANIVKGLSGEIEAAVRSVLDDGDAKL